MKNLLTLLLVVFFVLTGVGSAGSAGLLEKGFSSPAESAKTWVYWWWLNGYVTKDGIERDLDHMKKVGIDGALVFHAGSGQTPESTVFMSTQWRKLFSYAVEQAAKRGITIGMNLCGGWNAGGPWVKEEDGVKKLVYGSAEIAGPNTFGGGLESKEVKDETYHDISVLAWPVGADSVLKSTGMVDLTEKTDEGGRLKWEVPKGEWRVIQFGWKIPRAGRTKTTGGKRYLEIDPMSKKAMDNHFASTAGAVIEDVKKYVGTTFKYVHIDSGEIGHPDWTHTFREDFERLRGYDPQGFMAVKAGFVVDSDRVSKLFLEDYDQTVADLMIECYYGYLGELAEPFGLGTHSEAAGYQKPDVDAIKALGVNDICMAEYWSRGWFNEKPGEDYIHQLSAGALRYHDAIRNAAGAGHVYGRKIVQAEAYTVIRKFNYDGSFFDLKDVGDRAFCAGMNRNVLHHYISQPQEKSKPGYVWPGIGPEFDRHSTLWPMGEAWIGYLNRCQYLLQEGKFVGDFCYLQGDLAPAYVPAKWAMDPPMPAGFDCDTINSDALISRASVAEDGSLVAGDGQRYRYLVLDQSGRWERPASRIFVPDSFDPNTSAYCPESGSGIPLVIRPETLAKVKELVEAGLTVIGPKPVRSPGLGNSVENNEKINQLADEMWGKAEKDSGVRSVGKGRVIWGRSLAEVMAGDGVKPDLEIKESLETKALGVESLSGIPSPSTFGWIHRRVGGADVYFIANLRDAEAEGLFTFRIEDRQPELWDPVSGDIRDAAAFRETLDGRTAVPLEFARRGSIFVVFRKPLASGRIAAKSNFPELIPLLQLTGPWKVMFDSEWGAPDVAEFDELMDWSKRAEKGIKYYSGTATYSKTFDLPVGQKSKGRVYLDLGKVCEIAAVRLNGKKLGVVWTAPWRVEITGALREKDNNLEIDVANTWANRLIGDAGLEPEERLTVTNVKAFKKDTPLLESGLIGPVWILRR